MTGRIRSPQAPLVVLALVAALSLGARALMLGEPCQSPCRTAASHTLIFDEAYYVNAARVIAGIHPAKGSHYDQSPLGSDPNAEHPQGAKLIIAASIELFGDGPFAWRIGSLLFGTIAVLGMFALVRFAGGGSWPAVGAAALMACDNLLLVHGRIATLDIYAVALMVWGVALYARGSPWAAALALAVADCLKEVAPYALFVVALLELGRLGVAWRSPGYPAEWRPLPAARRLAITVVGSVAGFVLGLWVMGLIATPYADASRSLITGGPFHHLFHMIDYARTLTSPHGATGIASYPWQWLFDLKPITYLRINPSLPGDGLYAIHPVSAFFGMVSPPIIALAIPAMAVGAWWAWRARPESRAVEPAGPAPVAGTMSVAGTTSVAGEVQVALLGIAWFIGTWVPYELQSAIDSRTSYLYYMVVVMPGVYVSVAWLAALLWRRGAGWLRALVGVWALTVLAAVVLMYPFVAAF